MLHCVHEIDITLSADHGRVRWQWYYFIRGILFDKVGIGSPRCWASDFWIYRPAEALTYFIELTILKVIKLDYTNELKLW